MRTGAEFENRGRALTISQRFEENSQKFGSTEIHRDYDKGGRGLLMKLRTTSGDVAIICVEDGICFS